MADVRAAGDPTAEDVMQAAYPEAQWLVVVGVVIVVVFLVGVILEGLGLHLYFTRRDKKDDPE